MWKPITFRRFWDLKMDNGWHQLTGSGVLKHEGYWSEYGIDGEVMLRIEENPLMALPPAEQTKCYERS